jgi:hypothetical protein
LLDAEREALPGRARLIVWAVNPNAKVGDPIASEACRDGAASSRLFFSKP